jgi:hypothetical protein
MKRLLLILLLIALPFQVSWAAVGAYCQSEKTTASQHFGHHKHAAEFKAEFKSISLSDSSTDQEKSTGNVEECGFCHLSCTKFLTLVPSLIAPGQNGAEFPLPAPRIYRSPTVSPAEDPDWTLAA